MKDACRKVYFARCIGPRGEPIGAYKIGCSHGYNDRVNSLAANLPFSLELVAVAPGGWIMEHACHLRLRQHRIGGEYFHASDDVEGFIGNVAETGHPFRYIFDDGTDMHRTMTTHDMVALFMKYHRVSLQEACLFLGSSPKRYEGKKLNLKIAAATALVAASREQPVHWPMDALGGLTGEHAISLAMGPRAEAAA